MEMVDQFQSISGITAESSHIEVIVVPILGAETEMLLVLAPKTTSFPEITSHNNMMDILHICQPQSKS